MTDPHHWPVLTRYERDHLARIALPLGGIGTGTVSLGGRGDLRDWELVNRPAKGFVPKCAFFALWCRTAGGEPVTRALEGPLDVSLYEGATGAAAPNHGLPRFRECSFEAAYPFGQVLLADASVPLRVRLQAFNPLIPADAERSGIPAAVVRFVLDNPTADAVEASVCASLQNFVGTDGSAGAPLRNLNELRRAEGVPGLFLHSRGVEPQAEQWGSLALAAPGAAGLTYRTAWAKRIWGDSLLDFWDDFSADGRLEEREAEGEDAPIASLAVPVEVPPNGTAEVTFILAWHFPNRMTWNPRSAAERTGNYYTTVYHDAWDAAVRTALALPDLEQDTLCFVRAFCDSDLPEVVKEAALYNASTLRTQTCFRTEDGRFYGWEGCSDRRGCCEGSCTHVWNYEQATAFLFGDLSRSMREVEFLHATRDDGHMSFRMYLPLQHAAEHGLAAADGQMGCLMKLYRDWQLSGDTLWLRTLWPRARKALEFAWIPGGWDADQDGLMEGCQHNTMDVEYYGPNPEMGTWYLGALRAAEEMARALGDDAFADTCRDVFENGRALMDGQLFNGEYYEHEIRPPAEADIAPGLRHESMGARDLANPELQLGPGCLIDQLVGQYMAHVCGLGYLLDPEHVRAALHSLFRYNFRENLHGHFNHLRTYALADESGMLIATYPRGGRPERPFPYCSEVWTGLEYTAAAHMLYEGMVREGLTLIAAARARYDGRKRSPFDEAECGHHYARAMASWAAVPACTGFHYSGANGGTMRFARAVRPSQWFWSTGDAWGLVWQSPSPAGADVRLEVLYGTLTLTRLEIAGVGYAQHSEPQVLQEGQRLTLRIP